MIIDDVFNIKKFGKVISGSTPYEDDIQHEVGDILICGDKKWRVAAVDKIHQGCFMRPITRYHTLKLEPIDHEDQPNVGDDLTHE